MILSPFTAADGGELSRGSGPTLDSLFRRTAAARPHALALLDPPNRLQIDGAAPMRLSYAEADAVIDQIATTLQRLKLQADDIVGIQLPNTVDSVLAILAVLRAGLIAAPLPLLFGSTDATAALSSVGAKALISCSRVGALDQAERAFRVAAGVFTIRHVCTLGEDDLPDGMTPLRPDDLTMSYPITDAPDAISRAGNPGAHVAVITWHVGARGLVPVARSHAELIAGGLAVLMECPVRQTAPMLTTLPASSFGGLATGMLPWLLSSGALALHHGFAAEAMEAQCAELLPLLITIPGPILPAVQKAGLAGHGSGVGGLIATWPAAERLSASTDWTGGLAAVVDVQILGEIGLLAARRHPDGRPAAIALEQGASARHDGNITVTAEREITPRRTLAIRGPMVPRGFYPIASAESMLDISPAGFVDTGQPCRRDEAGTVTLTGPPPGISTVGGLRVRLGDVGARLAEMAPDLSLLALPDALLGHRLAAEAADMTEAGLLLAESGESSLVAAAFQSRQTNRGH